MSGPGTVVPPADAGWCELERGRWAEAAARFDDALRMAPDDPYGLEGRAWAAWWLNDASTLFRVREQAFHAHRAVGDVRGAARLAIWIACDHHEIRGEHAVANGWYARAHRLLESVPTCAEHAWLAFQEGAYAIELADDADTARAGAAEVAAIAEQLDLFDLAMLALALDGLALVTQGHVADGMRRLDEASVAALSGEVRERVAVTWTLCYLIYACERVRDFDRTTQWCNKMREVADRVGFEAGVGICRVHYGGVLVHHGDWSRAEHELEQARAVLERLRPAAVCESDARLGELRRRQGRSEEAEHLLLGALPHPLAALGLASLSMDRGDPAAALVHLEELVDATPAGSVTQLVDVLALQVDALAELGRIAEARELSSRLDAVATRVGNRPVSAMAAEARGVVALADGQLATGRRCLALAATTYERAGLPYESARVRRRLESSSADAGSSSQDTAAPRAAVPTEASAGPAVATAALPGLTPRETEVLALVVQGLRDRDIAEQLVISPHTVHRHVSNILTKLGVTSRTAAAAIGAGHGLGTQRPGPPKLGVPLAR